jgi:phage terminase large subunit GpA-like protein
MMQTTCEFWYLPCPQCGVLQILEWDRVRFDDLTHRCLQCQGHAEKYLWLAGEGEWRAHRPIDERGNKVRTRGFFIGGLYSPWVDWDVLRDEFVRAVRANEEGDVELLKAFRNTRLGLLHQDEGSKVKIDLYQRREVFECEVPDGVVVLTAGVDVQDQSLFAEVVGWGKGRESWGIDYITIPGDPRTAEPWEALDEALYNRIFITKDDAKMRVRRICVDSSFASDHVYNYTKPRQPRCIAIKGMGGLGKAPISAITFSKSNRCLIASLGVDTLKEEIMNRLNVTKFGPGFCHFPRTDLFDVAMQAHEPDRGYDVNYFEGLRAEQRIVKHKFGFKTYIWSKRVSQRNESWDCRVYALAALLIPHSGIRLDTMKRDTITITDDEKKAQQRSSKFGAQQVQPEFAREIEGRPTTTSKSAPQQRSKFGAQNRPIY